MKIVIMSEGFSASSAMWIKAALDDCHKNETIGIHVACAGGSLGATAHHPSENVFFPQPINANMLTSSLESIVKWEEYRDISMNVDERIDSFLRQAAMASGADFLDLQSEVKMLIGVDIQKNESLITKTVFEITAGDTDDVNELFLKDDKPHYRDLEYKHKKKRF